MLPKTADVVIEGGGVVGCAAAFWLAKAGLRPATPDELPFLDRHPALDSPIVGTGHYCSGILLDPLTGRLIHELILGLPRSIPLDPFQPNRSHLNPE